LNVFSDGSKVSKTVPHTPSLNFSISKQVLQLDPKHQSQSSFYFQIAFHLVCIITRLEIPSFKDRILKLILITSWQIVFGDLRTLASRHFRITSSCSCIAYLRAVVDLVKLARIFEGLR